MKKQSRQPRLILGFLYACAFIFFSCSADDNRYGFTPTNPNLFLSKNEFAVEKDKGEVAISFEANLPWRIESNNTWLVPNLVRGEAGKHTLQLTYDKNLALEDRVGTVTIKITDDSKGVITVKQAKANLDDTYSHYYVKENATGDGSSWEQATSLSKALELAVNNNDVIHIAEGNYQPEHSASIGSTLDKDKTFFIQTNLTLIGGYPKEATTGAKADPTRQTLLSGKNQSVHVVTIFAQKIANLAVTLKNITITEGNADAVASNLKIKGYDVPRDHGAGIISIESNVVLENCQVIRNNSGRHGAGIYAVKQSEWTISHSAINENVGVNTNSNGGGIFLNNSKANIHFSDISFNQAGGVAGGIQTLNNSEINLTNVTVTNNQARANGGGIYHRDNSKSLMINTYFYNNAATDGEGGAISTHNGAILHLISSTVYKNTSNKNFGAMNNQANNTIYLYNSLVFDNPSAANTNGINPAGTTAATQSALHNQIFGAENVVIGPFTPQQLNTADPLKIRPSAATSPLATQGFSVEELMELRNRLGSTSAIEVFTSDLDGQSRAGSRTIGAYRL